MRRTFLLHVLPLSFLLALAAGADASAARLADEGGAWVYRAAPGELDALHVRPDDQDPNAMLIRDENAPVTGSRPRAVRRALARRGCRARIRRVRSARVAKGRAVKRSHRAGRRLTRGRVVTILVSEGR